MKIPSPPTAVKTADAWRKFRALLWWNALAGGSAAALAIWWVGRGDANVSPHMILAMGGGIFLALMLGGALMGLVFLSSRIGHDEEAASGFETDDRF